MKYIIRRLVYYVALLFGMTVFTVPGIAAAQSFASTTNFVASTAGIAADGSVWVWLNGAAQPVQQVFSHPATSIIGFGSSYEALLSDGSVWIWTAGSSIAPKQVTGLPSIKILVPSQEMIGFTSAQQVDEGPVALQYVAQDGSVWTWLPSLTYSTDLSLGPPYTYGVTGQASEPCCTSPMKNSNIASVVDMDQAFPIQDPLFPTAYGTAFAVRTDGSLYGWGSNKVSDILPPTSASSYLPVLQSGFSNVVQVQYEVDEGDPVPADLNMYGIVAALLSNGTVQYRVYYVSNGVPGNPGVGTWGQAGTIPLSNVKKIQLTPENYLIMLRTDGTVYTSHFTGFDIYGSGYFNVPTQLTGIPPAQDIAYSLGAYNASACQGCYSYATNLFVTATAGQVVQVSPINSYTPTPKITTLAGAGSPVFYAVGTQLPPPANETFASSVLISGATGSTVGSNVGATAQAGDPGSAHAPVWYRWTASVTGVAEFSAVNSSSPLSTVVSVYSGSSLSNLSLVSAGATGPYTVNVPVVAGTTYYIAVDTTAGAYGAFTLTWNNYVSAGGGDATVPTLPQWAAMVMAMGLIGVAIRKQSRY